MVLPASVLLYSPSLGRDDTCKVLVENPDKLVLDKKTPRVEIRVFTVWSAVYLLYIEFHPFFQLVSYILFFPFCQVCNKNSRIK